MTDGNASAFTGFAQEGMFLPQPYPLWAVYTDSWNGERSVSLVIGWEVKSEDGRDTIVSPCFSDLSFNPESHGHIDYSVTDPRTPEDLKRYKPPMLTSACCEVGPITMKPCGCESPCPRCGESYVCNEHNKEDD